MGLKIFAPLLVLVIAFVQLGLQEKWYDRRTKKHRRILRLLAILMVVATLVTCVMVVQDASEASALRSQINELVEGKNELLLQNSELLATTEGYVKDLSAKDDQIQELRKQTAEAQRGVISVKENQAPWTLTSDQEKALRSLLAKAPKGKIEVTYLLSDGKRAGGLANTLEGTFRALGYDLAPEIGMVSNPRNPRGLIIKYRREQDRERAVVYCSIFNQVGLQCKWAKMGPNHVDLRAWLKEAVTVGVYMKPEALP